MKMQQSKVLFISLEEICFKKMIDFINGASQCERRFLFNAIGNNREERKDKRKDLNKCSGLS